MILERQLDGFEAQLRNIPVSKAIEYRGVVDESALARAFELLYTRHPVLRGRIRRNGGDLILGVPSGNRPEYVVTEGDEETLWREFRKQWDVAHAVAKLILVRGEECGFVMLIVDHAIADARCAVGFFDDLWHLYASVVDRSEIPMGNCMPLPISPSSLLNQRWNSGLDVPAVADSDAAIPMHVSASIHRNFDFSETETTRFLKAARSLSTSVHSLLCGAIVVALRNEERGLRFASPMVCWSAVDLRPRLNPPVGVTESTIFSFRHRAEIMVKLEDDLLTVGREIKAQLEETLERRELSTDLSAFLSSHVETPLDQHIAQVMVTNPGVRARIANPSGLEIIRHLRPVLKKTAMRFPVYAIHTYEGRMNIWCVYPSEFFTDVQVDRIFDSVTTELRGINA